MRYKMADSRTLLNQKKSVEPPIKKQRTQAGSSRDYDEKAPGEAMPVRFPPGLGEIMLDSLGGDINPQPQYDEKKKCPTDSYQSVRLFGRNFQELMHPGAAKVANLILRGEEKEVEEALALIKKNPDLLRYHTIATDPLGRLMKGTPLQIAAIAGDVDLRDGIQEEKDRGMVERLIAVGNLSKEEVAEQLKIITSKEAREENEKRNQRVLSAIKKFGQSICEVKVDSRPMSFEEFQASFKDHINQLEKDLQVRTNELTTSGYIFDPDILHKAAKWFEDNVMNVKGFSFGGWWTNQSDVFWVNGFGKLQSRLSARDAQVVGAGIGRFVDAGNLPSRTLNNSEGTSYFFNSSSGLGRTFYLGVDGARERTRGPRRGVWKTYVEQKHEHCKTYAIPRQSPTV